MARGVAYLKRTQEADGLWSQPHYTGGGFPRVFYLQLSRLSEILPALGPGALPQSQERAIPGGSSSGCEGHRVTILAVTGLKREAEIVGGAGRGGGGGRRRRGGRWPKSSTPCMATSRA